MAAPATLERAAFDEADVLERADALVAEGAYDRAVELLQYLLDVATRTGPTGDAVVPVKEPGVPFRADAPPPAGALWEGLAPAVRRRLAAWPRRGIESWRRRYDALARGLFDNARGRGDEAALLDLARRYPFTGAAADAARWLGDRALERGEPELALGLYERAAEDPDARASTKGRLAAARAALARSGPPEPRIPPGFCWDAEVRAVESLAGPDSERVQMQRQPLADTLPQLLELRAPDSAYALAAVLPGRVALAGERPRAAAGAAGATASVAARGGASAHGRAADAAHGRRPLLPPGSRYRPEGLGLIALGAATASHGALVAAIPRAEDDLELAGGRSARLVRPGRSWAGLRPALDLYAFDLAREGALAWTTAEPAPFGAEAAEWLARARFAGGVAAKGGIAIAIAVTEGAAHEVWLAAFDARAPRLLWRRFVAAGARGRWDAGPGLPRVAIAGRSAVIDTGSGVRAGFDLASGEPLWIALAGPAEGNAHAPRFPPRAPVRHLRAPLALPGPEPLVLCENPFAGTLDACDPSTGLVRWAVRSHWSVELAGTVGALVLVRDREGLWLIDPAREGRAVSGKLPLPPDRELVGAVAGGGSLFAVPLGHGALSGARDLLIVSALPPAAPRGAWALAAVNVIALPRPEQVAASPLLLADRSLAVLAHEQLIRFRLAPAEVIDDTRAASAVLALYLAGDPAESALRARTTAEMLKRAGTWSALLGLELPGGFALERRAGGEVRAVTTEGPALAVIREPVTGRLRVEVEAPVLDR